MIKFELKDSNKIKMSIALSGESIRSFSCKNGISHSYLSQIINCKKHPSAVIASKICKGLDAEIEDFFLVSLVDELPMKGVSE